MIPFQLHRRIPLVRRPFFQRDQALAEAAELKRRLAVVEQERDAVIAQRDQAAVSGSTAGLIITGLHRNTGQPKTGRRYLDTCAVYRGTIVVEGWAEAGPPTIFYKNEPVLTISYKIMRPDVAGHFGSGGEHWGFRSSAITPLPQLEHDGISLLFPDGEVIEVPGRAFQSPENAQFFTLTEQLLALSKPGDKVLEIGSRARSGNTYHHFVHPEVDYTGLDITAGPNVDVVGDAHHLSRFVSGPFDLVFSISVWEHLIMPWMVSLEMNKVMRDGAVAYIQSHAAFPLHEQPWDFWRFSKEAWRGLFNAHTGFEVIDSGYALRCLVVPDFASGAQLQGGDIAPSYLLSACLARKIGPPKTRWDAEASEVFNLDYDYS